MRYLCLLMLIFFSICTTLPAQQTAKTSLALDSLQQLIDGAGPDSMRLGAYKAYLLEIHTTDSAATMQYAEKGKALATQMGKAYDALYFDYLKAEFLFVNRYYDQVFPVYRHIRRKLAKTKNDTLLWRTNRMLGHLHQYQNQYDSALWYYNLCHVKEVAETSEEWEEWYSHIAMYMSVVYNRLDNPKKAIELLRTAAVSFEKLGNDAGQIKALKSIAHIHFMRKDYENTIAAFEYLLPVVQWMGNQMEEVDVTSWLGDVYRAKNEFGKAFQFYELAKQLSEEIGDFDQLAFVNNRMGGIYYSQCNYRRATQWTGCL